MGIVEELTVTQFKVLNLLVDEITLGTQARVVLLNANDGELFSDTVEITWTPGELAVIRAKIDARKAAFASATGWTEYTP
jgi:hypothetical protein